MLAAILPGALRVPYVATDWDRAFIGVTVFTMCIVAYVLAEGEDENN